MCGGARAAVERNDVGWTCAVFEIVKALKVVELLPAIVWLSFR